MFVSSHGIAMKTGMMTFKTVTEPILFMDSDQDEVIV